MLPSLEGSPELATGESSLVDDVGLSDDGGCSLLETWLDGGKGIGESGDDDKPDGDVEDGCKLPEDTREGRLES